MEFPIHGELRNCFSVLFCLGLEKNNNSITSHEMGYPAKKYVFKIMLYEA